MRFREGDIASAHGPLFFAYVMCVAAYFVIRSNYRNVHNIIPWAMTALATITAVSDVRIRSLQKVVVTYLGCFPNGVSCVLRSRSITPTVAEAL